MKRINKKKMKDKATSIILIIMVACGIMTVSCDQEKTQNKVNQALSVDVDNSYYYRNYHCFDFVKQCELEMLKLVKLDTVIYVSSTQFHGQYEEIHGKLTKINDSIYFVEPFKHLVQGGNGDKPFRVQQDSIFFYCDSSLIGTNLKIEYMNGQKEEYKVSSTENRLWINEEYFNKDNERIYLSFNHKNPIVDETVEIVSKYSETKYSIVFNSVKSSDNFYVIVNDKLIKTINIGNEGHQCSGPKFKLDKMPLDTDLPGNRKLYE